MFGGSKKAFSAVTVQIDRLTSEQYEEDDISGIFDLVEVVRIQDSGPTEAARAVRKKLYACNSPPERLDTSADDTNLVENAGGRFQRSFADEPLLERLRLMARDEAVDPRVRQKCKVLFVNWANNYKSSPGLERITTLYKEFPKTQRPAAARQKVLQDSDPFESPKDVNPPEEASVASSSRKQNHPLPASRPVTLTPTSSSFSSRLFKDKKSTSKGFNLAKEKDNMTNALAQASIASTNLLNGLQLINRETERVSENQEVIQRFEACKTLRRQILYYIQHVESDNWIGSLVNANDELVKALTAYEIMDRSISDDSDSDELDTHDAQQHSKSGKASGLSVQQQLAGLSVSEAPPAKPPRPVPAPPAMPMPPVPTFARAAANEEDDDDDPFGDSNAAPTPGAERPGMTWREI